jgi:hypothetical protein
MTNLLSAKASLDGNSNIDIKPSSREVKGSDAVANSLLPSPHATERTALLTERLGFVSEQNTKGFAIKALMNACKLPSSPLVWHSRYIFSS